MFHACNFSNNPGENEQNKNPLDEVLLLYQNAKIIKKYIYMKTANLGKIFHDKIEIDVLQMKSLTWQLYWF